VGAGVGNAGAACENGQSAYYDQGYRSAPRYDAYDRYGGNSYGGGYYGRDAYAPAYGGDWAYGRRGERYRVAQDRSVDRDGCTLAESPIYMPDGQSQTRFVRVCRDSSGRYAVVD
jgi:hypothetical protein